MEIPVLTPDEFFFGIVLAGILMLLCVYIPVQMVAKLRRIRIARSHVVCRICGYRFLRPGQEKICHCPHCGARNR